jgi:hypothetical protein
MIRSRSGCPIPKIAPSPRAVRPVRHRGSGDDRPRAVGPVPHDVRIAASGMDGAGDPHVPPRRPDQPRTSRPGGGDARLGEMTGTDVTTFERLSRRDPLRRAAFRARGATATDHDVPDLRTGMASPRGDRGIARPRRLKGALRRRRRTSTTVTCSSKWHRCRPKTAWSCRSMPAPRAPPIAHLPTGSAPTWAPTSRAR